MRNTFKAAALVLLCSMGAANGFAQIGQGHQEKNITKDETVIIKKDRGDGKTVVEIKDGTVYVNGEAVVTVHDADAARVHKKIIIENGESRDEPRVEAFSFPDNEPGAMDGPVRGPRKAMLGVMTDSHSEKVGALVKGVTPGSAAEKAGLKAGDLITRVDGKSIKDANALVTEIMGQHEPGDKVSINYERNGREEMTNATLQQASPAMSMRSFRFSPDDMNGEMPNGFMRGFPFMANDDMEASPKLGVSAEDRADGRGVRVLDVKPSSPADAAGLREGDVITMIGDDRLGSVDELQMSLRSHKPGDRIRLEYQREGRMQHADIMLPKPMKRKDL